MTIPNKYDLKQVVYLRTDTDQLPRIVTGIQIRPNLLIYNLACGTSESDHYDIEMSEEKNVLIDNCSEIIKE
jgi:hypothetical protein